MCCIHTVAAWAARSSMLMVFEYMFSVCCMRPTRALRGSGKTDFTSAMRTFTHGSRTPLPGGLLDDAMAAELAHTVAMRDPDMHAQIHAAVA